MVVDIKISALEILNFRHKTLVTTNNKRLEKYFTIYENMPNNLMNGLEELG